MRIWDVEPARLCRSHLLGEHRELHAVWTIILDDRRGYRSHPEVQRWRRRLPALYARHEDLVAEMARRGFRHASPLEPKGATGESTQPELLATEAEQLSRLRAKPCPCPLPTVHDRRSGSVRSRA